MGDYVNKRVAKDFDGTTYKGTVDNYDKAQKLWHVKYDDGDEEEMDEGELIKAMTKAEAADSAIDSRKKGASKVKKKKNEKKAEQEPKSKTKTKVKHRKLNDANLQYSPLRPSSKRKGDDDAKFIDARVAKRFGDGKTHYGTIDKVDNRNRLFHATYDDGDGEDFNADELSYHLDLYNELDKSARLKLEIPEKAYPDEKKGTYKVTWTVKKEITEFGDSAFDDCNRDEADDAEEMYRESEINIKPSQLKNVYRTIEMANAVAADQLKILSNHHIEVEDVDKVKEKAGGDRRKKWSWSYKKTDEEFENIFLCEGTVEVKMVG